MVEQPDLNTLFKKLPPSGGDWAYHEGLSGHLWEKWQGDQRAGGGPTWDRRLMNQTE